jgi:hypothetical protein
MVREAFSFPMTHYWKRRSTPAGAADQILVRQRD